MKIHKLENQENKFYCEQNLFIKFASTKDAIKCLKLHNQSGSRNVKELKLQFGRFFKDATDQEMADLINKRIENFFSEVNKITKNYATYKFDIEYFEDGSHKKL
jgi:hypothetical protein